VPALSPARSRAAASHAARGTRKTTTTAAPVTVAPPSNERPMTRTEAAKFLNYSIHTMANLAVLNRGPRYYGTGKHTFYFESELLAWVRGLPTGGEERTA
jgi:hypothetical protein